MKTRRIMELAMLFISVVLFATSCQQDEEISKVTEKATVTISMKGIGSNTGQAQTKAANAPEVQYLSTTFRGEEALVTLTEAGSASTRAAGEITPLPAGTKFTVAAYAADAAEATDSHEFIQQGGDDNYAFNLTAGTYTFKAYAYGNAGATEGSADKDPLWWQQEVTVAAGESLNLDIVLKHLLTQVTVVFNAGDGKTISAINSGDNAQSVMTNYAYTFDTTNGTVIFGDKPGTAANIMFPTQDAGNSWTSNPVMIAVPEKDNNVTVKLKGVVIDNVTGEVELNNVTLNPGVQYTLTINLGASNKRIFTVKVPKGTTTCYIKGGFQDLGGDNWSTYHEMTRNNDGTFSIEMLAYANVEYMYFASNDGTTPNYEVDKFGVQVKHTQWAEQDEVVAWYILPQATNVTIQCTVPADIQELYVKGSFDNWAKFNKMTLVTDEVPATTKAAAGTKVFTYTYQTNSPTSLEVKFATGPDNKYLQTATENNKAVGQDISNGYNFAFEFTSATGENGFKAIYNPAETQWGETNETSGEATNKYW